MSSEKVVGSMSDWSGVLKDLFRQIDDGSLALGELKFFLEHRRGLLANDVRFLLEDWQKFYKNVFGIDVDFSSLTIPAKPDGFDRLIVVAQGMTPESLFQKCKELFPSWKYTDAKLDEVITSARSAKNSSYAVWTKNCQEADEKYKNKSANDIKEKGVDTLTLEERLVYELKFFRETGDHLDRKMITLCAGSRDSDGGVPRVDWCDGRMRVHWYDPDDAHGFLRARQAVS